MIAGLDAFDLEGVPQPDGVVAAIAEQPLRFEHFAKQRYHFDVVAGLASGNEEARGLAICVGD